MASYNLVNGRPAHLSPLINEELRRWTDDEVLVVGDAGAVSNIAGRAAVPARPRRRVRRRAAAPGWTASPRTTPTPARRSSGSARRCAAACSTGRHRQGRPPGPDPADAARRVRPAGQPVRRSPGADAGPPRTARCARSRSSCSGTTHSCSRSTDCADRRRPRPARRHRPHRLVQRHPPVRDQRPCRAGRPGHARRCRRRRRPRRASAPTADAGAANTTSSTGARAWWRCGRSTAAGSSAQTTTVALVDDRHGPGGWVVRETFRLVDRPDGRVAAAPPRHRPLCAARPTAPCARTRPSRTTSPLLSFVDGVGAAAALAAGRRRGGCGRRQPPDGQRPGDRGPGRPGPAGRVRTRCCAPSYAANPRTVLVLTSSYPYAVELGRRPPAGVLWSAHGGQELRRRARRRAASARPTRAAGSPRPGTARAAELPDLLDYDVIGNDATYLYYRGEPLYPFGHGLSLHLLRYTGPLHRVGRSVGDGRGDEHRAAGRRRGGPALHPATPFPGQAAAAAAARFAKVASRAGRIGHRAAAARGTRPRLLGRRARPVRRGDARGTR